MDYLFDLQLFMDIDIIVQLSCVKRPLFTKAHGHILFTISVFVVYFYAKQGHLFQNKASIFFL